MTKINDSIRFILNRDAFICQYPRCYDKAVQIAHRIAKSEDNKKVIQDIITGKNIKIKVNDVIHHPLNLVACCYRMSHNDGFNIGNKPEQSNELINKIIEEIENGSK